VCASECDGGTSQRRPSECVRLSVMEEPHTGGLPSVCVECDRGTSQRRPSECVLLSVMEEPHRGDLGPLGLSC